MISWTVLKLKIIKLLTSWRTEKYNLESIAVKFLLKKDRLDMRDYKAVPVKTVDLPQKVSLREFCPPIKNQLSISSCGSHAWITAYEIMLKQKNKDWLIEGSERHHYYHVRQSEYMDTYPGDSGQQLRFGAKVLTKIGMAPEFLCPYIVKDYNVLPSTLAESYTRFWTPKSYSRVETVPDMKFLLAQSYPIVFGVKIYTSFFSLSTYTLAMPNSRDRVLGGHAMVIVGYDENKRVFEVVNSHGRSYGDEGYLWISYEYMTKYLLDAWIMDL
jgi:C1A family cysteine protease